MKGGNDRARLVRRAFTLLEVLMVLVILGLLASLVVYNLAGVGDKARKDTTYTNIVLIEGAVELFRAQVGRYPKELLELVQKPENEVDAKNWAGPYIKEKDVDKLKDAWQRELIYKCPGEYNQSSYDLASPGPDGQEGTDDDIVNWKRS